jgi:methionine sulfoxide reductase catalytic subunit
MLIKKPSDFRWSEITPKSVYMNRRKFLVGTAVAAGAVLAARSVEDWLKPEPALAAGAKLQVAFKSPFSTTEMLTPYRVVTTYNNFYEFGTDKSDPSHYAKNFKTSPWSVKVEGEVAKPQTFSVGELMKMAPLEERIYRHRCVEAWSIVVPWIGYSLSVLIKKVQPTAKAKFVQFFTDLDPKQMPGLREAALNWPYREGLRMDEAMNPLTTLCFGLYGEVLPNQDGAPLRTVIPWKYGFKSTKSIVRIRFMQKQPDTTWNTESPSEYGFYSNVNPHVDHPRWSQKTERRLTGSLFSDKRIPTLMFNGYADQVASMYAGMDLRKYF